MNFIKNEKLLRQVCYFWSCVAMVFLIMDFLNHERYGYLFNYISSIYLGILSIYAGTKEFSRWRNVYGDSKRHPGEWFVIIWTLLIFILFICSGVWNKQIYKLSSEAMAVYISIITIFTITQRSKQLYRNKRILN